MVDFREYVLSHSAQPEVPVVDEVIEPDRSEQLSEVAEGVFYCFALPMPPVLPRQKYVEGSRNFEEGSFTIRVYSEGVNFGAKITVARGRDTIEAGQVHADALPDEIAMGLLESCRAAILRDYHPDPNMHECKWTRHKWSEKGRRLLEVLNRVNSIPRVRSLLESEVHHAPPAEPFSIAWVGWTGSSTDHELQGFVTNHLTSPSSQVYDKDAAECWPHAHEDFINIQEGRDFLKERVKYSVVVLCWLYNPRNGYNPEYDGQYTMSPSHSKEEWIRRLVSTGADYIYASGGGTEVSGEFLGNLPGYEKDKPAPTITEYTNHRKLIS